MRISRNYPYTKSVGAALGRRHGPFVNVISIAARAPSLGQDGDSGIAQRIILRLAVVGFDPHVFRVDRTEMDFGRGLERVSHRNFLPILVTNLDVADSHLRPVLSHLRFP